MTADTGYPPTSSLPIRLTPLFTAILAAIATLITATLRNYPLPLDIAAILLTIGLATTWIARHTPLRGVLFIAILSLTILTLVYAT